MSERLPLPNGFRAAVTAVACARLRAPDLRHGLSSDHLLAVPLAEQPTDRIPRQRGTYIATYDFYRLDTRTASPPTAITALLSSGQQDARW